KTAYGADQRRPAVHFQLEQARRRLSAFAAKHAELVAEGWRIVYAEDEADGLSLPFLVDEEPTLLVGRIDRIDYHDGMRTLRILDYKTADTAAKPDKTHHDGKHWIDLQLPLYRHLRRAAPLEVPGGCRVQLGYFNLPKELEATDVDVAEWDQTALDEADETARRVIHQLRR